DQQLWPGPSRALPGRGVGDVLGYRRGVHHWPRTLWGTLPERWLPRLDRVHAGAGGGVRHHLAAGHPGGRWPHHEPRRLPQRRGHEHPPGVPRLSAAAAGPRPAQYGQHLGLLGPATGPADQCPPDPLNDATITTPQPPGTAMTSIYDFSATDIQGNEVSLADYRGKVLLIVNT